MILSYTTIQLFSQTNLQCVLEIYFLKRSTPTPFPGIHSFQKLHPKNKNPYRILVIDPLLCSLILELASCWLYIEDHTFVHKTSCQSLQRGRIVKPRERIAQTHRVNLYNMKAQVVRLLFFISNNTYGSLFLIVLFSEFMEMMSILRLLDH